MEAIMVRPCWCKCDPAGVGVTLQVTLAASDIRDPAVSAVIANTLATFHLQMVGGLTRDLYNVVTW